MRAEPEDKLHADSARGSFPTRHILLIVLIVAVLLLFWTSRVEKDVPEPAPEPAVVEETVLEPLPLPPAPDIPPRPEPLKPPELIGENIEPITPPLPPLPESDELAREQLLAAGAGSKLAKLQSGDHLVETATALIDGFSRGLVIRKILPVDPPAQPFSMEGESDQTFMNPQGYRRYDEYAQAFTALDTSALVEGFHLLRPLYEQAYGQLGLKPDDFDNALIRVLDLVLATPEIEQPIALTRKSVMWLYADPALEKLSPLQKQLLRMGPDNIRRIKAKARAIRAGLLAGAM